MQDNLNFVVKDNFLTDMQLDKLKRVLSPMGIDVRYEKKGDSYNLDMMWDSSVVYRKSNRYAGRSKIHTDLDWDQIDHLKALGMTNDEISDHLGVNIRTFYRRQSDHKKDTES